MLSKKWQAFDASGNCFFVFYVDFIDVYPKISFCCIFSVFIGQTWLNVKMKYENQFIESAFILDFENTKVKKQNLVIKHIIYHVGFTYDSSIKTILEEKVKSLNNTRLIRHDFISF